MSGADDEPEAWDPTRPLTEGGRGRARSPEPLSDDAPGERPSRGPASEGDRAQEGDGAADAAPRGARGDGSVPDADAGAVAGRGTGDRGGGRSSPVLLPHLERLAALATRASGLEEGAARYAGWVEETLRGGGKLLFCGNGGSAATAEHVAAEYVVRFERTRDPLAAVALSGAGAVATAASNDYAFEDVFARQVRALGGSGDLAVLHSTSGESENLLRAAAAAREQGIRTVGLLAAGGGRLAEAVDLALVVPTDEGARAQELHLAVEHAVVDRVEAALADADGQAPAGPGT